MAATLKATCFMPVSRSAAPRACVGASTRLQVGPHGCRCPLMTGRSYWETRPWRMRLRQVVWRRPSSGCWSSGTEEELMAVEPPSGGGPGPVDEQVLPSERPQPTYLRGPESSPGRRLGGEPTQAPRETLGPTRSSASLAAFPRVFLIPRCTLPAMQRWVDWYNQRRLHSAIGHLPPTEYERGYWRQLEAPDAA